MTGSILARILENPKEFENFELIWREWFSENSGTDLAIESLAVQKSINFQTGSYSDLEIRLKALPKDESLGIGYSFAMRVVFDRIWSLVAEQNNDFDKGRDNFVNFEWQHEHPEINSAIQHLSNVAAFHLGWILGTEQLAEELGFEAEALSNVTGHKDELTHDAIDYPITPSEIPKLIGFLEN